ncbi:beta-lactamase/transpeptidase-like protein [Mollisia scopiformis]|uniref:Beta-lactamase/transpeptidase-like protein n=1 Tax=Mollisia scopiformis TaxID=149040 RepID=A0A194XK37_MOLSC|nr:beta-lactamase/transpeptidase-like protein [Mollisia scopiformis]KUJ20474.1 beta-lactamase/transpeptidase-like protein [Mollisia scopiformis]
MHTTNPLDEEFAELAEYTLDQWNVPGLSIAVVDGHDIWAEGYGYATLPSIKATSETLYYGGSLTKSHTAAAVSLLITSGNYSGLTLQTPVSALIREDFVLEDEWATKHITLEDVLGHRTGMARHDMSYGGDYGGHMGTPKDVVRSLRYLPMSSEPRSTFHYSNIMYVAAAYVVDTMSGQRIADFLKERVWGPLGMKSTFFSLTDAKKAASKRMAVGYSWQEDHYESTPHPDVTVITGAGSIIASVHDHARWLRALLSCSAPLTEADCKELKSPRTFIADQPEGSPYAGFMAYTLGWETDWYNGYQVFMHSGGIEAFGNHIIFIPELNWAAVASGNTAYTSTFACIELIHKLLDDKIGLSHAQRFNWLEYHKGKRLKQINFYNDAQSNFYPYTLDKRPLSLQLERYAGTYYNPGFRNFTIYVKDDTLQIDRYASYNVHMDLEQVTGDYFMAYMDSMTVPGSIYQNAVAAEFVIGPDGVARKFGIAEEPSMGPNGRVWFDRVDGV